METTFEYNAMQIYSNELKVESVGNICLRGIDSIKGLEHILYINTELGVSNVIELHGYDKLMLSNNFTLKYTSMNYDDYKLEKMIEKFLNKSAVTFKQVDILDYNKFLVEYDNISIRELLKR